MCMCARTHAQTHTDTQSPSLTWLKPFTFPIENKAFFAVQEVPTLNSISTCFCKLHLDNLGPWIHLQVRGNEFFPEHSQLEKWRKVKGQEKALAKSREDA